LGDRALRTRLLGGLGKVLRFLIIFWIFYRFLGLIIGAIIGGDLTLVILGAPRTICLIVGAIADLAIIALRAKLLGISIISLYWSFFWYRTLELEGLLTSINFLF
jgi:membrane protein implicated in regulation of membrane protease activity